MALTGVHLAFGATHNSNGENTLPYALCLTQTMASAGTSSANPNNAITLLTVSASAPIFYAIGPSPDATNGLRRYMDPANGDRDLYVNPGDKVAWILA